MARHVSIEIKRLPSGASSPSYETEQAAGMDCRRVTGR